MISLDFPIRIEYGKTLSENSVEVTLSELGELDLGGNFFV